MAFRSPEMRKRSFLVCRGGPLCPPAGKGVVPQKSNANSYWILEKYEFAQHFRKFIPPAAGGHMGPPLRTHRLAFRSPEMRKRSFLVCRGGPLCPPAGKGVVPQKSNANSYWILEKYEFAQHFRKFIPPAAGGHMGPPLRTHRLTFRSPEMRKRSFLVCRGLSLCPPAGKGVIPQKSNANSYRILEKNEFAQHFRKFIPLPRADTWVRPYGHLTGLSRNRHPTGPFKNSAAGTFLFVLWKTACFPGENAVK